MRIYDWIIIIGFAILFGWCIVVNNKYSTLQKDYSILKNNEKFVVDSLNRENMKIKVEMDFLIDSLNKVNDSIVENITKTELVEKSEFTVSSSFSKSTKLLKENLVCTDL